ncbi:helix-turn-helix domain-containing protein [Micromonospora mirobrigensis]|uniref:Transcriptional regulator, AraC family n=1 Tax=Micromonospora mirobrigensis TaxID=262898 RepID=A0A1C5AB43_9ACTN|nr:AraC family transcriptional regulator [Micromonospora mirobrigensis]SCF42301.1 transcriptional regulator, AraC family [Micromonospora mirobrigensis]
MTGTEFVVGRPAPRLRPFVDRYLGYREAAPVPLVRTEVAGAFVVLVIGWGAPLDVVDGRAADRGAYGVASFLAGPFDGYCTTSTVGVGAGVQLLLEPLTARRLLGFPLGEVANRAVPLEQLPDRWLDRLRQRLAEERRWPGRFALLDAALTSRLVETAGTDPRLRRAWQRLAHGGAGVAVATVADELGWSRRHLAVRFHREFGLPPRTVVRLARFHRAYAVLAAGPAGGSGPTPVVPATGPAGGWADLAARFGYYDQSHLIREFREFAGATPGALFRSGSHSSNTG